MDYLENLTAENVNSGRFSTLAHGYIVPGDVVYIPFGAILCEKAVACSNVSLRVSSLLIHKHQCPSADHYHKRLPQETWICLSSSSA